MSTRMHSILSHLLRTGTVLALSVVLMACPRPEEQQTPVSHYRNTYNPLTVASGFESYYTSSYETGYTDGAAGRWNSGNLPVQTCMSADYNTCVWLNYNRPPGSAVPCGDIYLKGRAQNAGYYAGVWDGMADYVPVAGCKSPPVAAFRYLYCNPESGQCGNRDVENHFYYLSMGSSIAEPYSRILRQGTGGSILFQVKDDYGMGASGLEVTWSVIGSDGFRESGIAQRAVHHEYIACGRGTTISMYSYDFSIPIPSSPGTVKDTIVVKIKNDYGELTMNKVVEFG